MKKRGEKINIINIKLYNDEILVLNKTLEANLIESEYISYTDDFVVTTINLNNNIFSRQSDEFLFTLDINKKTITYKLLKEDLEFSEKDVLCSIEIKNNIIINYEFDGKRKLIIEKIK